MCTTNQDSFCEELVALKMAVCESYPRHQMDFKYLFLRDSSQRNSSDLDLAILFVMSFSWEITRVKIERLKGLYKSVIIIF